MFEDPQPKKSITMVMNNYATNERVEITLDHSVDTAWPDIAYQFWQFLSGMGYIVKMEDVGAEI